MSDNQSLLSETTQGQELQNLKEMTDHLLQSSLSSDALSRVQDIQGEIATIENNLSSFLLYGLELYTKTDELSSLVKQIYKIAVIPNIKKEDSDTLLNFRLSMKQSQQNIGNFISSLSANSSTPLLDMQSTFTSFFESLNEIIDDAKETEDRYHSYSSFLQNSGRMNKGITPFSFTKNK